MPEGGASKASLLSFFLRHSFITLGVVFLSILRKFSENLTNKIGMKSFFSFYSLFSFLVFPFGSCRLALINFEQEAKFYKLIVIFPLLVSFFFTYWFSIELYHTIVPPPLSWVAGELAKKLSSGRLLLFPNNL
jgi:hypothetical protein